MNVTRMRARRSRALSAARTRYLAACEAGDFRTLSSADATLRGFYIGYRRLNVPAPRALALVWTLHRKTRNAAVWGAGSIWPKTSRVRSFVTPSGPCTRRGV